MAGIGSFVRHTKQSNFGGQWLNWKDDKKVTLWLHTHVEPLPVWGHSFMHMDIVEDKETGRSKPVLRSPRFVSPDPEVVHLSQFFRKDDDSLKVMPDRDPFLLLREWLRIADHIGLEDVIFKWKDPRDNQTIEWCRGELSGKVKRARSNFAHSLDTKQEYLFVVVLNDEPDKGAHISRESSALGRRVGEVISQMQAGLGDEGGDPLINPYPFTWTFDKKALPNEMYKAFKAEGVTCTDEVWAAITSSDYPDPNEYATARDGDMEKIRAAFEAAAQVELPLDELFSEDSAVRLGLISKAKRRPVAGQRQAPPAAPQRPAEGQVATTPRGQVQRPQNPASAQAGATTQRGQVQRPGAPQGAATARQAPPPPSNGAQRPGAPVAAAEAPAVGRTRRRKVEPAPEPEPEPQPEPDVEKIPCDCGYLMLVTETVCTKCGAVYEIDDDALEDAAPPQLAAGQNRCFSCKAVIQGTYCEVCKLHTNDPLPF